MKILFFIFTACVTLQFNLIAQNFWEQTIPPTFSLLQNYPNSFNPNSMIEYSIHKYSFVALKVYDILGKEITTLVNEEKSAGSYEVKFDANSLSSGIYFYKIQAGDYSSVKKMILIK